MDCLFCRFISGEIAIDTIYEDEELIAFHDINPVAPTHILLVPRIHVKNAEELARVSPTGLVHIFNVAGEIARERSLLGYRTLFNTGEIAGQSIFHAHLHLIGGRELHWPPG
jgi:histidine triad (HIT) family protein